MACGGSVVSRSPSFSEAVSHALQKLQMSRVSLKEEQHLSMKAMFDRPANSSAVTGRHHDRSSKQHIA